VPAADFTTYARRVAAAARRADAAPTEAQREAVNHRVGSVHIHGHHITITNPKGSIRRGISDDGREWQRVMKAHYGYIRRTTSHDGEQLDVFIGEHPESQLVFVVSQLDKDGNFDEFKCILGCRNYQEAKKLYAAHYPESWVEDRTGEIRGFFMRDFREWLRKEKLLKKSAAEWVTSLAKLAAPDKLPGGYADHRPDSDFPKRELEKGRREEMKEHTTDPQVAGEIAKDHIAENGPDYYEKLDKMEKAEEAGGEKSAFLLAIGRLARRAKAAAAPPVPGAPGPLPPPPTSGDYKPNVGGTDRSNTVQTPGAQTQPLAGGWNAAAQPPRPQPQPQPAPAYAPPAKGYAAAPAAAPVAPPKPAPGPDDPVAADQKLWAQPDYPKWLDFVNSNTAPTGGRTLFGSTAGPEDAVMGHVFNMPRAGVDRLVDTLHNGTTVGREYMDKWLLPGGGRGGRPLLAADQLHNDPTAWGLYKDWAGGREFPAEIQTRSVTSGGVPGRPDSASMGLLNRELLDNQYEGTAVRPSGLAAIHEGTHVSQVGARRGAQSPLGNATQELVPSLNDIPYAEEYTRRLQADHGVPVTGSGLSVGLPSGDKFTTATLHQQAKEHGLFDTGAGRKSMSELLNTNAGRAWLARQTGGAK